MSIGFANLRLVRFSPLSQTVFSSLRLFSSDTDVTNSDKEVNSKLIRKPRYKIFQDDESPVILDVTEQQIIYQKERISAVEITEDPATYTRGVTGVFDVEELVDILRKDNAEDIFVVRVAKELKYVDYLVIATGKSKRHLLGLAEYVRSIYKKKRNPTDLIPIIEGENSSDWVAMDLGNIALHIMSKTARELYDLESLWSVGATYDTKLQTEEDSVLMLLKEHSILLDDIQPLKGG